MIILCTNLKRINSPRFDALMKKWNKIKKDEWILWSVKKGLGNCSLFIVMFCVQRPHSSVNRQFLVCHTANTGFCSSSIRFDLRLRVITEYICNSVTSQHHPKNVYKPDCQLNGINFFHFLHLLRHSVGMIRCVRYNTIHKYKQ